MTIKMEAETGQTPAWVPSLRQLEQLSKLLAKALADETSRPGREAEFATLQGGLPPEVFTLLRSRIGRGERLVAPVRGGQCGACYTRASRGDYLRVVAGKGVTACEYCHVVLYADDAERALVASQRK